MGADFPTEYLWMERLAAVAVALQTIELLQIRDSFGEDGPWAWSAVRAEYCGMPAPLARLLDWVMGPRGFILLLTVRLALALAAPLAPEVSAWAWAALWLSTLLIAMRWRGTFNGGSDYMTLIVLAALAAGRALGPTHPRWIAVSLGYAGVQTCLSFFVAGWAKLRSARWRDGTALTGFASSEYYGASATIGARAEFARPLAWLVIGFECLFPLCLLNPRLCLAAIGAAIAFQLGNFGVLGLNRFVWAWGAAYPALYWCSVYLSRS